MKTTASKSLPALVGYNPKRHMRVPFGYLEWDGKNYICRNAQGSNLGEVKTYTAAKTHVSATYSSL